MITIVGGTGRLGSRLANRLTTGGTTVRVLSRRPSRPGVFTHPELVEQQIGDVRNHDDATRAVRDTTVVVSAIQGFAGPRGSSPETIDRDGNEQLIDAAGDSGAEVVMMSVVGASLDHPMDLFRMKRTAEQYLLASGVPATVVRSTAYLDLYLDLLRQTAGRSGRPTVFGHGTNPINFVAVDDVVALLERVIRDPASRGEVLEIGGPQNLTFNDLAAAVAGPGRSAKHVPPTVLRVLCATAGRVRPTLGRQIGAALVMDRLDFTLDRASARTRYPDLPVTTVADLLSNEASVRMPGIGR